MKLDNILVNKYLLKNGTIMKKIIIYLTIASLLNLFGCYYQQQMTPEKYNFADNGDIQVTTKDTVYKFKGDDYYYNNDTLFATVSKPLDESSNLKYTISIPVENIEMVEAKKMDTLDTILLTGVITLVILGFVGLGSGGGWQGR